jgi:hypothetical protein
MYSLNPLAHPKLLSKLFPIFVAIGLVVLIFPDVIFYDASISMTGVYTGGFYNFDVMKLLPEPLHRAAHHGFTDTGGAVFQSEPMIQFMKEVLYHFESPYWNPYSAAGSLGPETLVDQKFSFLTLLVALAGGSDAAFHIIILSLYAFAIYFFYRLLREYLNISKIAAITACVVYMLNGYHVANLNSNVSQVYLYFPMLLFALCAFARQTSTLRFVALVFANIIIFSTTFFPTTALVLLSTYIIALGYIISLSTDKQKPIGYSIKLVALQGSTTFIALLVLSFIYLPIIESFSVLNTIDMYNDRVFIPVKKYGLLSLFTPKHFWESYNAIDAIIHSWFPVTEANKHLPYPEFDPSLIGNIIFHLGIVASLVGTAALTRWKFHRGAIIGAALFILILSLGRIFDVLWIGKFIERIVFLGSIGEQYWWVAIAVAFPILVAYGMEALKEKKVTWIPFIIVSAIILYCVYINWKIFGIIEPHRDSRIISLIILGSLLVISFYLFEKMKNTSSTKTINILSIIFFILIFAELNYYVNHFRYSRHDVMQSPSLEVSFLREHAGLYRVANIGRVGLTSEYGAAYQIQQIESLNMNILPPYLKFFQNNFLKDVAQRWGLFPTFQLFQDKPQLNLTALNFLGVKYIVVPFNFNEYIKYFSSNGYKPVFETPWTIIFENKNVYPRIFAVSALINGETHFKDSSLRDIAFTKDKKLLGLAEAYGIKIDQSNSTSAGDLKNLKTIPNSAVQILEYHHAHITAAANLSEPAVIVLPDNWHPNWKAFVNGRSAYIGIVNETFRGIVLPAGQSNIEMQYCSETLSAALVISGSTLIGLLGITLWRRRIDGWLKNHLN